MPIKLKLEHDDSTFDGIFRRVWAAKKVYDVLVGRHVDNLSIYQSVTSPADYPGKVLVVLSRLGSEEKGVPFRSIVTDMESFAEAANDLIEDILEREQKVCFESNETIANRVIDLLNFPFVYYDTFSGDGTEALFEVMVQESFTAAEVDEILNRAGCAEEDDLAEMYQAIRKSDHPQRGGGEIASAAINWWYQNFDADTAKHYLDAGIYDHRIADYLHDGDWLEYVKDVSQKDLIEIGLLPEGGHPNILSGIDFLQVEGITKAPFLIEKLREKREADRV
jgi:hypothetical protein